MVNRLYNKQVSPKGYKKGGHVNTRRMNRLEELGRVDSERADTRSGKRNLGAEKRRIVRELRAKGGKVQGYKDRKDESIAMRIRKKRTAAQLKASRDDSYGRFGSKAKKSGKINR
jgi:hypothetical protein